MVRVEQAVRLEEALEAVQRRHSRGGEIRALRALPARPASAAAEPPPLGERIIAFLQEHGTWPLWSHQAESIRRTRKGEHVVVASATASGKSLCYNLPVLDALIAGRPSHALYLFPTKALAQDQMRALGGLIDGLGIRTEAGIYDGDTEPVLRRRLRRRGRIVLTNPDMLHTAILPHHGSWAGLFEHLEFVVVDELHTLRGIFGSHVANVLRRLRRLARHHGSDPCFICTSATIANPREHAEKLLGVPVSLVASDGAPRGEKSYVLWNPPLFERDDGTSFRKSAASVAVRILPELVRRGVKTICFARSRNRVELILRTLKERRRSPAVETPPPPVETYRGGYLPSERREIERRLFAGELGGVVSTNALELGIDIGDLDGCIIAGWPGSVCSFLQQAGRAGRRSGASAVFFVAGPEPVDQYFMRHPEALFESNPERAVVEWGNPYILVRHLVCAAYELPLGDVDRELFGEELPALLALLAEEGRLRQEGGRWYYVDGDYPAKSVPLRTAGDENFTIYERSSGRVVGELDYVAAMLSLYEGAVYLHRTETHVVEELDHRNRLAKIRRADTGYYTQALCQKQITEREEWERKEERGAVLTLMAADVITHITGYKKVRFHTVENIGYGNVDLPPLELDTVALCVALGGEVTGPADRYGPEFLRAGLSGTARLFRDMLSIRALCDPADLDTFIDCQRFYVYDLYPGGIGYSEIGFEEYPAILEATLEAVVDCPCAAGCPSCVLPGGSRRESAAAEEGLEYPYPKEATRFLLHLMLGREPYQPVLEAVAVAPAEAPGAPRPRLDPRTERKVRQAIRRRPRP